MEQRLKYFEWHLNWIGSANRGVLTEKFGVSGSQATTDIRNYILRRKEENLPPLHYSPQERCYKTEFEFKTVWEHPVPGIKPQKVEKLESFEFLHMPLIPTRDVRKEAAILSRICYSREKIDIEYVGNNGREKRTIAPHTIAWDGIRLECRAYCHLRQEYRSFIIGRILSITPTISSGQKVKSQTKAEDTAWNEQTELCYGLNSDQKNLEGLSHEYGMQKEETKKLPIKKSWERTILQRLGFSSIKPLFTKK